jgi:hypothetical protein
VLECQLIGRQRCYLFLCSKAVVAHDLRYVFLLPRPNDRYFVDACVLFSLDVSCFERITSYTMCKSSDHITSTCFFLRVLPVDQTASNSSCKKKPRFKFQCRLALFFFLLTLFNFVTVFA